MHKIKGKKVKWSSYGPGVAQRVGTGIALLFHGRGVRRGWVVSSTPRPQFTPGKDPVPILQEAGWTPGPVWTGGKSGTHWDSIPNRPALIDYILYIIMAKFIALPTFLCIKLTSSELTDDVQWTSDLINLYYCLKRYKNHYHPSIHKSCLRVWIF